MTCNKINSYSPDSLSNSLREWYLIKKSKPKIETKEKLENNTINTNLVLKHKLTGKNNIYSSIGYSPDPLSIVLREWWQVTKSYKNK